MACRGSTDERSMRYLRFRIIADRAEASHACSRRTRFFGKEKETERLTVTRSGANTRLNSKVTLKHVNGRERATYHYETWVYRHVHEPLECHCCSLVCAWY
jgi:hypothetical protein